MQEPNPIVRRGVLALVLLLGNPLTAYAQESTTPDSMPAAPDPVTATAEWMLEQSEPRMRAAGLVVLADNEDKDRTAAIIENARGTTDGAAMLWLAHACRQAGIQRECIEAGLDRAIVQYDGGNLFARVALHEEADFADLILETRRESMYYFSLIEAWYDALSKADVAVDEGSPGQRLAQAYAIAAAWATPAFVPLMETCRDADPGGDVDRACQQLAGRVIDSGESMLGTMVAMAVQRRGKPASNEERSAAETASNRAGCQMQALEPELIAMDDAGVREVLGLLKRHGEFETWDRLAERHEIDCSNPLPAVDDMAEQEARFNATVATVARDMVQSSDDRKRAAGLAWQLTNYSQPIEAPNEMLDELDAQIRSITDPAALAWLATSCDFNNIEDFCRAAGLDAALVKHDPGNLLSRLPLLDDTTIESALLQSTRVRSYYDEAGATWYPELYPELEPLSEEEQAEMGMSHPMYVMSTAFILPSPYAMPSYGPLAQFCKSRGDANDDATLACARIGDELVENGRTLFELLVGMDLRRQLAQRAGDVGEDEMLKDQAEDVYARHICHSQALRSTWETVTRGEVEAWIAEQLEYGELRAYARAAERAGVDCSNPQP